MNQHEALSIANRDEIVARYQRLRSVSRNLNHKLLERLSKEMLHEGGKKLGIFRGGTLVFDSEDDTSVLMDYCLYDVRRNGRNTVEQYLIDSLPDLESDEMVCLRAMQHAVYSLYIVESVERGLGVTVRDLRSDERLLVVDMGFASTAQPGLVLASRMLPHDGFWITGGAALPISALPPDEQDAVTKDLLQATSLLSEDDGYFDPAPLIRSCLRQGCSSNVQYQEASGSGIRQRRASGRRHSGKVGRNAPCPCGSGKKFKQCCMKRR